MISDIEQREQELRAMKVAWAVREATAEIIAENRAEILMRASAKLNASGVPCERKDLEKAHESQVP